MTSSKVLLVPGKPHRTISEYRYGTVRDPSRTHAGRQVDRFAGFSSCTTHTTVADREGGAVCGDTSLPLSRKREQEGTDRSPNYHEPRPADKRRLMLQSRVDRLYMDGVPVLSNR